MSTILLIEDNLEMRENTAEILELAGYDVLTAEDGKIGVRHAQTHHPNLIICDIMMPELDGYGVLYMLNKQEATASIPFIFLTAKAEMSDLRRGMNLGADDYLTKPYDETELLEAVEMRLKKQQQEHEQEEATQLRLEAPQSIGDMVGDRKKRSFAKKETIYRESDYANYLYYIEEGLVKLMKSDDYGKELVTDLYGPGSCFGHNGLLQSEAYPETAIALSDVTLVAIPRQDFLQELQDNPSIANHVIRTLASSVREREERMLQMAYAPVREKVANTLLLLEKRLTKATGTSPEIAISREDLAGIAGTATESLIRMLSEFKEDGYIQVESRKIKIIDQTGLRNLASQ